MEIIPFDYKYIEDILPLLSDNIPYVYPHHKYSYWILGEYFPSLCYLAKDGENIEGFVCALHSAEKNSVFIWQLVVRGSNRRKGVAKLLCDEILAYVNKNKVKSIQLTINNENSASIAFFTAFARKQGTALKKIAFSASSSFDDETAYEVKILKEKSYEIFKESESYLMCPLCDTDFCVSENKNLICANNHSFDIAAKGYVNLIPNQKQSSDYYSKQLFESRAHVFEAGAYDKIYGEIADVILSKFAHINNGKNVTILDVGCGEGYYAAKLSELSEIKTNVFAIDIIKDAILASCKKKAPVKWLVADLTKIPLKNGSADVLLNILTGANYDEFKRVLSDIGIIIKVIPGKDYLKEIRGIVKEKLRNKEYSNKDVLEYLQKHIKIIEKRTVNYQFPVNEQLFKHFMQMTPLTGGLNIENMHFEQVAQVTIDMDIVVGIK